MNQLQAFFLHAVNIDQEDIRLGHLAQLDDLGRAAGFPDQMQIAYLPQQLTQTAPVDGLVGGDGNTQ